MALCKARLWHGTPPCFLFHTLSPASAEDVLTVEERVFCPTAQRLCSSLGQKGYVTLDPRVSSHWGLEVCFAVAISEQCHEKGPHILPRGAQGMGQNSAQLQPQLQCPHSAQSRRWSPMEVCTRHPRKTLWIHTEAATGDIAKDGATQHNPVWASWH